MPSEMKSPLSLIKLAALTTVLAPGLILIAVKYFDSPYLILSAVFALMIAFWIIASYRWPKIRSLGTDTPSKIGDDENREEIARLRDRTRDLERRLGDLSTAG